MSKIINAVLSRFSAKYKSIDELGKLYLTQLQTKDYAAKTIQNKACYVNHVCRLFSGLSVSQLTPAKIYRTLEAFNEVRSQTAKCTLIELRHMLTLALKLGWVDENVALRVVLTKSKVQRTRLSLQQWRAMYDYSAASSKPWVPLMLLLALLTGQRRADLLAMRHSDIRDGYLYVRQQKTGAKLAIPLSIGLDVLSITLKEVVDCCHRYGASSDYLLHKLNGQQLCAATLSYRFEQVREAALGLWREPGTPPTLHECRALSAWLYQEQGGVDVVQLLGHLDYKMTAVYLSRRRREQAGWRYIVRQPATGGGSGEHATAAVRT